jgi:hypothetical protein
MQPGTTEARNTMHSPIYNITDCRLLDLQEWRVANGMDRTKPDTIGEILEHAMYQARFCRAAMLASVEARADEAREAWNAMTAEERVHAPDPDFDAPGVDSTLMHHYDLTIAQCRIALAALYTKLEG